MLGAGALGRPRGMEWGGRREEGPGRGTHVHPWRIHLDTRQNQYNYVKFKNKIKLKKKKKIWLFLLVACFSSDFEQASREHSAGVLSLKFLATMSWSSRLPGFTRLGKAACTLWPGWSPWRWCLTLVMQITPDPVGRRECLQETQASMVAPARIPNLAPPLQVS